LSASVFIDGAVGTTGLEIRERLDGRADLTLITLPDDQRKEIGARRAALNAADVVILCLPDDAAREAVALIDNPRTRVIDASSAHRVASGWTYGFPELGFDVAGATRVSNPGCYPTGFLALVAPLMRAGLLRGDAALVVHGTSGYSGGGKTMIAAFEGGDGSAHRAYALDLGHKHLPEMTRHAGLSVPPIFLPAVADVHRGMVIEVPLHGSQLATGTDAAAIRTVLGEAYADAPLVRVADGSATLIRIEDDAGTDRLTLHVFGNPDGSQFRLIATLDNLGKGASGAAVQSLNLMLGVDPLTGLAT
jgi:N-acetyl-gamma-glutamyl-phosphate reductase